MNIYIIFEHKRELHYKSNIIPRIDELVYFPHHGTFRVKKIVYHISDDCENDNELMWVEIHVIKENI